MKHLNKLASVFCMAAMGLTALTGCEGSDMYSVNSPDWLSEKIDSIEKSKVSTEEVLVGMNEDVYTVGNTDFSSGFWTSFSKYYVVQDNQKWNAVFNLNINPSATNTYKNFALIITNDVDRGGTGYTEYGAIRFDNQPSGNSEWGDHIDRSCVQSNLTFETDTDKGVDKLGGKVTLTVDRSRVDTFMVKITNGTVTKTYIQPSKIANLNAASAALSRKDTLLAEKYLKKAETSTPEYENAVGVLHLLRGDYEQAKLHLNKAAESGLRQANLNLEELAKKEENIELMSKLDY